MALAEDTEIFIERRRDEEVAIYYDLKMKGMRIGRIFSYISLVKKVDVETVKRDLRIRKVIGKEADRKMEEAIMKKNKSKRKRRVK